MKRVLLTGMSGTGKSSVVRALVARGYKAIDTDDGWSEPLPDGRQQWREDAIQALLSTEDADVLFVAGCEENQTRFHPRFDHIVLLSAPAQTVVERLAARAGNPYGKAPGELSRVLDDINNVEPALRRAAHHEVQTTMPLNEVVATVLRLVGATPIVRSGDRPVLDRGPRFPTLHRLVDGANGSNAVTVLRNVFTGREAIPAHTHEVEEVLLVTTGECVVTVAGRSEVAKAGDAVIVTPGTSHAIRHDSGERCEVIAVLADPDVRIPTAR